MKTLLYLCFMALLATCAAKAQYYAYSRSSNGTNSIVIPNGETWQIVNWTATGSWNDYYFRLSTSDAISLAGTGGAFLSLENPASSQPIGVVIQGPNTLRAQSAVLQSPGYDYYIVLKKILSMSSNSVSATSVIIPTSATGDVDVKLEQSADNVTWTECLPGTYNSSTVKRFFRLRAVEK